MEGCGSREGVERRNWRVEVVEFEGKT